MQQINFSIFSISLNRIPLIAQFTIPRYSPNVSPGMGAMRTGRVCKYALSPLNAFLHLLVQLQDDPFLIEELALGSFRGFGNQSIKSDDHSIEFVNLFLEFWWQYSGYLSNLCLADFYSSVIICPRNMVEVAQKYTCLYFTSC